MQEILGSNPVNPVIVTDLHSQQSTHSVICLVQENEYSEYLSKSDAIEATGLPQLNSCPFTILC